ncbi:VanZ family protein [Clostridium psychrophilum]|uniref:VanZ family protein n=1 Tax=Clostridium psychrophilum TaxID=132926 RepID=UPI001C0C34A0|nr:VanZ family protein [Clostridium psychrophilum]MBU3181006.1 VanZ family protein [Clostridium psychrophilum]
MKKLGILLCLLSLGFIFYNSSRPGALSNLRSYGIVQSIRDVKYDVEGKTNTTKAKAGVLPISSRDEKINLIIRKNAHAFEYALLAVLVSNVLFSLGLKGKNALTTIMFICLLFAVTDEFHQMFVPGRTSLVSDVIIDFSGSLVGIVLFYIAYYKIYVKRLIKNKKGLDIK